MANKMQMNETARIILDEITSKDVNDLTVYDIGFLKARYSYLTTDLKNFYKDALTGKFKGKDFVEVEVKEEVK